MKNINLSLNRFAVLGLIVLGILVALFSVAPLAFAQTASSVTCNSVTLQGDFTINPAGTQVYAWFEWGTSNSLPLGNSTSQQSFISTGAMQTYNAYISGLQPSTTYYYRAIGSVGSPGNILNFTTLSSSSCSGNNQQPSVTTNNPTNINQNGATFNGFANGNGQTTNGWFEWGTNTSFGNTTSQTFIGTGSQSYSFTVGNLNQNTTYYYRAVAQNGSGTVYGSSQSFTTSTTGGSTNQPYITTYSSTGVGDTFAILNGYVDPNGNITTRWFEWGTSNGYLGSQTIKLNQGLSAGAFNQSITGLQPNTVYYFRAVGQSSSGQVYGNVLTFTTTGYGNTIYNTGGGTNLQAVTLLVTNIGQTSGRLNGLAIINNYGVQAPSVNSYFEWGTDSTLYTSNTTPTQSIGNAPSISFFASLFNLQSNTRYYYRAVATNSYGTSKGDILNFVTGSTAVNSVTTTSSTVVVKKTTNNVARNSTSQPSLMALDIDQDGLCLVSGNIISYTVNYKNTSDRALKDVVLRVLLPQELSYNNSDRGVYSEKDKTVVLTLGNVASGDSGAMTVRTDVVRGAEIGKTIVVTAYLVDTDTVSGAQEEVVAYSLNRICENRNGQSALSFFGGNGFLPDTLLEWLFLILVIFGLIVLARNFYGEKEKGKTK
ncbi:MAG: hypothetical protein AAB488_00975 [Patescibacteria group bacterium]